MKTQEEILARIKSPQEGHTDLVVFLTFENAKEFLKEGVKEEEWNIVEPTQENVKNIMIQYLPFAWDKANGCRGLSADRSIQHFSVWLWLYDEEKLAEMEKIEYEHYGKEKLVYVSELIGFDWKAVDNGIRTNTDY